MSKELQTQTLSPEEITAILQGQGAVDEEAEEFHRIKTDGTNFVSDNDIWMSNPKTGEPAFVARLLQSPVQYQSFWFTPEAATEAGRPEMANRFCKSHYDNPQENREFGTNGASCRACPFNPFDKSVYPRCSWKGDIQFQIIPEDGVMKGDEIVWTMTLSVTGMIEWKGTRANPTGGSATDQNFMHRLATLAAGMAPEWGVNAEQAIVEALTSLQGGGVAAEFRAIRVSNEQSGNTWTVPSLNPVHIERMSGTDAQIEGGE
jgi:hypothetical protein